MNKTRFSRLNESPRCSVTTETTAFRFGCRSLELTRALAETAHPPTPLQRESKRDESIRDHLLPPYAGQCRHGPSGSHDFSQDCTLCCDVVQSFFFASEQGLNFLSRENTEILDANP